MLMYCNTINTVIVNTLTMEKYLIQPQLKTSNNYPFNIQAGAVLTNQIAFCTFCLDHHSDWPVEDS